MVPFKFFKGKVYTDEYTVPNPPYGISRRHWNILPEHIKNGTFDEMMAYIQGWELVPNPYTNFRLGELWYWGHRDRRARF